MKKLSDELSRQANLIRLVNIVWVDVLSQSPTAPISKNSLKKQFDEKIYQFVTISYLIKYSISKVNKIFEVENLGPVSI